MKKKKRKAGNDLDPKAEQLSLLIGEYVSVKLRNMQTIETVPGLDAVGISSSVDGFISDVTNEYIYISDNETCEDFHTMIDLHNLGAVAIVDKMETTGLELFEMPPGDTH